MKFSNGGMICQDIDDLPNLQDQDVLFLDFETTSGDETKDSINPWHNCYIAGVSVKVPGCDKSWYASVGCNRGGNLPYEPVYKWLTSIVGTCKRWVNHNVKYDAHVYANNTGHVPTCELYDTVCQSKIIHSDRMRYGLDALAKDWLGHNINPYEDRLQPYLHKNKDYGWIPIDIIGEYACQDVVTNEQLYNYILSKMPEECQEVSDTELAVTSTLFDIERNGMHINVNQVKIEQYKALKRMSELSEQLEDLVGYVINPTSNDDCFDVLCNKYGLPVLSWNDSGNPSFDKGALASYLTLPESPKLICKLMLEYRRLSTFNGVFLDPYLRLNIDGVLHPSYNQTVRTGRMSCSMPNMQQLMLEAKALIIPPEDHYIISADYSQIEYRLIAHYIKDVDTIRAYEDNPDTDFHQWVADLCGIKRKPAKTVNFLMGYGGGKKKLISALSLNEDVVKDIDASDPEEFKRMAAARGMVIYETYHAKLPGLKRTARQAEDLCRQRGYVKNIHGRRRHLPSDWAHKAFNTVNQSSAADIMKERLVALHRAGLLDLIGVVHDEIIGVIHKDAYDELLKVKVATILESPSASLRVPLRIGFGLSSNNWLDASDNSTPVEL